jgi:hypothetical protein
VALGPPKGIPNMLLRHVVCYCFGFLSLFMFVLTVSFWSRRSHWAIPLVDKMTPRAAAIIIALVIVLLAFVSWVMLTQ